MNTEIYKSLFKNSFSVMLIIHPDTGRIIDTNTAACKYYGYRHEEMVNMQIQDINTLSEKEVFLEMQNASDENRNYFNFQHRLASGEVRDVEVFSGPIIINDEKVLYSIINDITKRKRIEEQITLERQFSESLINSLPGVMYVIDQAGRYIRWNKNFETVTGYTSDLIAGMSPLDFIASEDKDLVGKTIKKVFKEGKADVEAKFATINGTMIPYLFTGYKLTQNSMDFIVGVGLDISARTKVEEEKQYLIEKLQESLSHVKELSGLIPICASCKNIRDDKGYWNKIENYIRDHSKVEFSHSLCPDCAKRLYPDIFKDESCFHDEKK